MKNKFKFSLMPSLWFCFKKHPWPNVVSNSEEPTTGLYACDLETKPDRKLYYTGAVKSACLWMANKIWVLLLLSCLLWSSFVLKEVWGKVTSTKIQLAIASMLFHHCHIFWFPAAGTEYVGFCNQQQSLIIWAWTEATIGAVQRQHEKM